MAFHFASDYRARVLALPQMLRQGGAGPGAAIPGGESEFRGHRPLVAGDDLRHVDWNIFARLDQLHVKQFGKGDAPEVLLLLDRSGSMFDAAGGKDRLSRELAGALGYLGLMTGSEVVLALAGQGGAVTLGRWRGEKRFDTLIHTLEALEDPSGPTWVERLAQLPPRTGAGRSALLFSDVLADPLPAAAFAALGRCSAAAVLLLSAGAESELPAGNWHCRGAEKEPALQVHADSSLRAAYAMALENHAQSVVALATAHRMACVRATDSQAFEHVVQQLARRVAA